jgi:hypothetical protein
MIYQALERRPGRLWSFGNLAINQVPASFPSNDVGGLEWQEVSLVLKSPTPYLNAEVLGLVKLEEIIEQVVYLILALGHSVKHVLDWFVGLLNFPLQPFFDVGEAALDGESI